MWRKPEENKSASAAQEISTTPVSTPVSERPAAVAVTSPVPQPAITTPPRSPSVAFADPTAQPAGRISRTLTI